jgi:hypothetical protein
MVEVDNGEGTTQLLSSSKHEKHSFWTVSEIVYEYRLFLVIALLMHIFTFEKVLHRIPLLA